MAATNAAAMDTSGMGTTPKKPATSLGNAPATPQQGPPAPQASPGPESFLKKLHPPADVPSLLYEPTHPTYLYLFLTKPDGTKGASKWPFTCAADFLPYITGICMATNILATRLCCSA